MVRFASALLLLLVIAAPVMARAEPVAPLVEQSTAGGYIFFHYQLTVYPNGAVVLARRYDSGRSETIRDTVPPVLLDQVARAVTDLAWARQGDLLLATIPDEVATVTYRAGEASFSVGHGSVRATVPDAVAALGRACAAVYQRLTASCN